MLNRECLKYFTENQSTNIINNNADVYAVSNIIPEELLGEYRLKNYFMFKSTIPYFYSPKREQKIGRAIRLTGKNMSK